MGKYPFLLALPLLVAVPRTLSTQSISSWSIRLDVGRYEVHDQDATGLAVGVHLGRRLAAPLLLASGLSHGIGDDSFTALEFAAELQFLPRSRVNVFAAGGIGLMLEWQPGGPSLSGPYYGAAGLEFVVDSDNRIRGTLRRGQHISFGDPGTFHGPHVLSLSWVRRL